MAKRKRSEASIERSVCEKAFKRWGVINRKMNGPGARAWPDRLFMWNPRGTLFIEFKRPGEEATDLQRDNHAKLRARGFQVEVCDDVAIALGYIKTAMEESRHEPR